MQHHGLQYTITTKHPSTRTDHDIPEVAYANSKYYIGIDHGSRHWTHQLADRNTFTLGVESTAGCCIDTQLLSFFVLGKTSSFELLATRLMRLCDRIFYRMHTNRITTFFVEAMIVTTTHHVSETPTRLMAALGL